jgi:protein-glutamine gamma-glutamyltransferase
MVNIEDVLKIITYLCVVCGFAAVVPYVGISYLISFLVLFCLAIYLDITAIVRIPRWVLNVISVLVLTLALIRVTPEYLVEPILDALIILVTIKLLEDKKFRDYMQIYALCIFLLIGSSLISLSIVFIVYFSILATLSTISLILLAYFSQDPHLTIRTDSVAKIIYQSLLICAISIPASSIFFIILPRTNYPILSFLNQSGYARSGFSNKVALGEVSEIQEDDSAIFRAEMDEVEEGSLYWRGIVLDVFDGIQWKRSTEAPVAQARPIEGRKIVQEIYIEPYGDKALFALDKPISVVMGNVKRSHDWSSPLARHLDTLTYSLREDLHERTRYRATSVPSRFLPDDSINRDKYLQLPQNLSTRIKELVQTFDTSHGEAKLVDSLLKFIKWGDYKYSLENLPTSASPLEDFLFEQKSGNCEYFSSSLAVMLRLAGIPARLVGGYKGGAYNKAGKYYLVLQRNAHVWVEAYLVNLGWIRLDPTPDIFADPSLMYRESLFMQAKLLLDTFNYYWYKLVINYDLNKQLAIIDEIQATVRRPNFSLNWGSFDFKHHLTWASCVLAAIFVIFGIMKGRKSPERKLIAGFEKRMIRRGYRRLSSEGLEEFVARVAEADLQVKASRFVKEFEEVFYRDRPFRGCEVKRLESVIKDL